MYSRGRKPATSGEEGESSQAIRRARAGRSYVAIILKLFTVSRSVAEPEPSVADPYHFDPDPDPGKNDTDPNPRKKGFSTRKLFKILSKRTYPMFCVFIFLNCHFSINNQLNLVKNINLSSVFNGFCWIRIIRYGPRSREVIGILRIRIRNTAKASLFFGWSWSRSDFTYL